MQRIPDISQYDRHLVVTDVDLDGIVIPGLTGHYFQRQAEGRTATAGRYLYTGLELFISWGYRDEAHCAWTSYRSRAGAWTAPHSGCPRVLHQAGAVLLDTGESIVRLPTQPRPGVCQPFQ